MTAAPLRPPDRLAGRVIPYWILGDGLTAVVFASLLWFLARPYLAEVVDNKWLNEQEIWADYVGPIWEQLLLGVCIGLISLAVLVAPIYYLRYRYGFVDDLLLMRYGILFVEERAVPVRRMQHVDLVRGPIERMFGLATLVVFTAGNEGSAFRVPGLPHGRAKELRDRIVQMRGDGRL